jgi:hypothetical protein
MVSNHLQENCNCRSLSSVMIFPWGADKNWRGSILPTLHFAVVIFVDVARILQFVVYMQQAELNGFQDRSRNTQHFVMAIRPFFNSPECRKVFRKTFYRLGSTIQARMYNNNCVC